MTRRAQPRPLPALARLADLALLAGLALLTALAPACGGDSAARADLERVRSACDTLVGSTVGAADAAIRAPAFVECSASLSPLNAADTCPGAPGPYTETVCQLGYEFCAPPASSLCNPLGGCAYACVVRVAAASPDQIAAGSTVCATRFVSGQPFGPVSGRLCQ